LPSPYWQNGSFPGDAGAPDAKTAERTCLKTLMSSGKTHAGPKVSSAGLFAKPCQSIYGRVFLLMLKRHAAAFLIIRQIIA